MIRRITWLVAILVAGGCGTGGGAADSKPVSVIALVGGRVQPSPDATVVPEGVVLITGGRITAVGRRADVSVPPGATIVDCAGTLTSAT
jgi:imidazolonepropionase-like amidohydrolase